MIPFAPESKEELKARYPAAVLGTFIPDENMFPRPGQLRTNVFDFEDGVRMIISRDRIAKEGKDVIHFSGSITDSYTWDTFEIFLNGLKEKFSYLSGIPAENFELVFVSQTKHVPHFIVKE